MFPKHLHAQQVRDGHVVHQVGISVDQVPGTSAGAATNGDPDEGPDGGQMATADDGHSAKSDVPCSVEVAGSLFDDKPPVSGEVFPASSVAYDMTPDNIAGDESIAQAPASSAATGVESNKRKYSSLETAHAHACLPINLPPRMFCVQTQKNALAVQRLCVRDLDRPVDTSGDQVPDTESGAAVNGDHDEGPDEGMMATPITRHSGIDHGPWRENVARRVRSAARRFEDDREDVNDLFLAKSPGSDQRDVLTSASAQTAPILDGNGDSPHLPVVLPPHAAAEKEPGQDDGPEGAEVESQRLPDKDEASTEGDRPEEDAVTNGLPRPSSSSQVAARHVETHDEPRVRDDSAPGAPASAASDMSSWVDYKYLGIAVGGLLLLVLTVKSRIKNRVTSVLTRAFSIVRNQVSRARAVDLPTWHPTVEETLQSLALVILMARSKIPPMGESSAYMELISRPDMAERIAAWYDYRWVVVGMLVPLFLDVMRIVTRDTIDMTMLAMSRVRGRLPQGRAARPYHWHYMRTGAVAIVAKIVVVDGLRALMWWVSEQVAANFVSGWRGVFCWLLVVGSGAYMHSYTLDVMSSIRNEMVAVATRAFSIVLRQGSPGRGAEPPRWHPFRAVTAMFSSGLAAVVVARIAETDAWSALVVWASCRATVARGRLPFILQLVSVSWKTLGVAAAAAGLTAWVMVVYVAAAVLFFVCTNRMTAPMRTLVWIFELYAEWGEPHSTTQLALRVRLHRNVLCRAHGTDASLKAAVFSVLSRLEPGEDHTQVLLVAKSFSDVGDLSVLLHTFAGVTGTPITVSMADWSEWQQEVRAQVVIGTASTLSGFLDRGVVDPSNVKAFVVDLGNNDPSLQGGPCSFARAFFSAWAFTALCYAGYWVLPLAFPSFTSSATALLWEVFAGLGRVAASLLVLVGNLWWGLFSLLVHATTVIRALPSFIGGLLATTAGLVGNLLGGLFASLVHPSTVIRVFSSFVGALAAATAELVSTLWCGLSAVVVRVAAVIQVLTPCLGDLAAATAELAVILSHGLFAVVVPATAALIRGLSVCACGLVGLLKIVVSLWSELAVTAVGGRLLWVLGRQEQRLSASATATVAAASPRAADSDTTTACLLKGKVDGSGAPASGSALPSHGNIVLAGNSAPPLPTCAHPLAPQPSAKPQLKSCSTQTALAPEPGNLDVCPDVVAQPSSEPQRSVATSSTQTPTASWVSPLVPRGITNRRETYSLNRCFLNSTVQLLRASPELVSLLLRESKVGAAARLLEGGRALSDPAPRTLEELQNDLLFKLAMVLKIEDWEGCPSHVCPGFYHTEGKKTLRLGTSPQSIFVPIFRNPTGSKITRDVTFPLDDLELVTTQAHSKAETTHYMAVAVMQHLGRYCNSGHNVTLVRKVSNAGSGWWACDDEDIVSVPSACVTRNAVAVLYRRVPDS
ncbi:unnamed protein product [Ectocarpus fasciculatus]